MAAVAAPPAPAPATSPAPATPAAEEIRASSYVGFDSITSQIEHKLLKRGFQFNVIVVGACLAGLSWYLELPTLNV